jgi:hypothetical protein
VQETSCAPTTVMWVCAAYLRTGTHGAQSPQLNRPAGKGYLAGLQVLAHKLTHTLLAPPLDMVADSMAFNACNKGLVSIRLYRY